MKLLTYRAINNTNIVTMPLSIDKFYDEIIDCIKKAVAATIPTNKVNKNSSEDEIANINFLRRYGTYVLQNTKKENLLRLTN